MELDKKLDKIFKKRKGFVPFDLILEDMNRKSVSISSDELDERLSVSDKYLEVADGVWAAAAELFDGVKFFAVVEPSDMEQGVVYLAGDELLLLTDSVARHGRGTVFFDDEEVDIYPGVSPDGNYYLGGFQRFFSSLEQTNEGGVVVFTVEDYSAGIFSGEMVDHSFLEQLRNNREAALIPEQILQYLEEGGLVSEGADIETGGPVQLQSGEMLLFMLYLEEWDFTRLPANLSFYLCFDERFRLVNDTQPGEQQLSQMGEYYMGGPMTIDIEQPDLDLLNRALELVYRQINPEEGIYLLKELKLRHPRIHVLNKFLYQAAYELDLDEEVLEYAESYAHHFSKDPDPYVVRADIFLKQDLPDRAEESLMEAQERLHPDDSDFRSELYTLWIYLNLRRGNIIGAISMARSALLANPENSEAAEFLEAHGHSTNPEVLAAAEQESRVIRVDFSKR